MDERVWFYAEADQQHGPLSLEQLAKALAVQGQPREVLVWRVGLAAWAAAGEVPEILERLLAEPVWHVAEDGASRGPLTLDGLLSALVGRSDPGGAMVWRAGLEAWKPAREVTELAGQIPPPIPAATRAGSTTITRRRPVVGPVPTPAPPEAPPDGPIDQEAPAPRPPRLPPAVARRRRRGYLSPQRLGMFGVAVLAGYAIAALLTSSSGSRREASPVPAAGADAPSADPAPRPGQTPIDPERYRSACNTGVALACTHLGVAYMDGLGVPADPVQGRELLRRGCEGDNALGCYALAAALEAMSEGAPPPNVLALYQKACRLGHAPACEAAGRR